MILLIKDQSTALWLQGIAGTGFVWTKDLHKAHGFESSRNLLEWVSDPTKKQLVNCIIVTAKEITQPKYETTGTI